MKTTDKEWLAFTFRVTDREVPHEELYSRVGPKTKMRWSRNNNGGHLRLGTYESEIRYFSSLGENEKGSENEEAGLSVRIARERRELRFLYPILSWHLRLGRTSALLIALPYVGLAREMLAHGRLRIEGEVEFAAPNLETVYTNIIGNKVASIDEALASDRALMLVRAGRVNFAADSNLRAAVLLGDNVFESVLYKKLAPSLDQTGDVWLGTDVARMAFWGATRRRIVAQLDRYGNFKVRVGGGGERLGLLAELIASIHKQDALEWREKFPPFRVQELS